MTSLQQCKFIKLFPDEKIKITEGSSVYSLMQACAKQIEILPESFNLFRIVQKRSILLPYRKKLPNCSKSNCPLTFRVIDFNFDLEGSYFKDVSLLNYIYHQIVFDLFSDPSAVDCNSSILEVLAADISKIFHQLSCQNLKEAYDLYFELYESRLPLKNRFSFEKFQNSCSKINTSSEFSCLVHIVTVYVKEIYSDLDVMKRTYNAKMSNKPSGVKGKSLEKKFILEVSSKYVKAKSDDKQHEDIFFLKQDKQSSENSAHNKILQRISFQEKTSVSLVYKMGTQCDHAPVVVSFKSTKELEAFVSLVDYYFYSVYPYKFLIYKFHDIKIDENSVQHIPDTSFNLINRDPHVSHFMDLEDAKNGLQKVLKHTGSYTIVKPSKNNSFLLLYTIQDKITPKQIFRRDGLYRIVGNEACHSRTIKAFVAILKPTVDGRRVNLDKHMSDSVLIDVLTFGHFRANIPPMLVSIKHPYIHCSYTHKTYEGSFEDLSGHDTKCKVIEFSELVDRRWFTELYTSLLQVTKDSIVKYIGFCKLGKTPRVYAFVNYDAMIYLDKFLEESPPAPYISLSIIQQIASALEKLHSFKIEHSCPAPHHILIDTLSCQSAYETPQFGINIKLTDVGLSKMMFLKEPSKNPFCIKNPFCTKDGQFELRWLPESFLMHPSPAFSVSVDRWVFGITVWQIFNNGSIPLGKHSNEELLNRYLKIKEQQNCLDGNMASNIPFQGWFPLKLDIPKQDDLTVNKKIQKLVNYTITDHLNDQEDAFEEIADLFNNDVFPLDRSVNIYEKLERNTEMKIEKKDGRLYFRRQQITAPSQPSVYSQSLDPVYDYGDSNVFDVHTDCSDGSDYSSSIDCENVDPETDFSNSGPVPDWYHQATTSDAFNYFSDNCDNSDPFYNDELSFTLLQECELQNQLHKFNNKKWESSFYKLGETVGAGNFGEVCKAIVQENERIPPELRRREIAVKIFSLPAAHDNAIETIVQEAENMLRLEHNRIVPLYGISSSLENKEIHIIMPFYQMGSLKSYIRQFHNELKEKDLCLFGLQIAEGMEYLNSKGFVHRDLALRNILVVSHKNVRIADLGLTRGVVKDQDYYYFVNKSMKAGLPTLWYPPEFFNKSKYDKYCDVWSYGVTMFEMWSNGEIPYKRYRVQKQPELIEFLKTRTLDIPEGTPRIFVHVMKRCWKEKRERWDFTAIVNFIKSKLCSPRYTTENAEDMYIYTQSRVCGGNFATQKVPVKETNGLKILNPFNFTEASKDVENRDPEIQYNELTVRRYETSFSEDHIKKILGLKHRHMMQYVGYVYTGGLLYSAAPVHSIGTLHDWCASARADMFTKKKGYAAQVIQGMLFLLSQNITHGSLSIHNVWLRDNYCAVISEAGMVASMRSDKLTHQNVITYPLEVLEGMVQDQEVMLDPRTDTWMFGVMLLHMFSPEPPYSQVRPEGDAATVMEVCESICGVLKKDISALCVESIRPAEIKSALSLCFTEVNSRGDISVLKPCFQT